MGGRGATSRSGKIANESVIEKAKTFQELKTYVENKYGLSFGKGMRQLPLENVKEVSRAIERLEKDFPEVTKDVEFITGGSWKSDWAASAKAKPFLNNQTGKVELKELKVELNRDFFKNNFSIQGDYTISGNNKRVTVAHELGHIATYKVAGYGYVNYCENVVKFAERATKQKRSDISRYAGGKYQESVAEAFADVAKNKNGAKAISKEIYKQVKKDW